MDVKLTSFWRHQATEGSLYRRDAFRIPGTEAEGQGLVWIYLFRMSLGLYGHRIITRKYRNRSVLRHVFIQVD
jgi:hypothetical protein